MKFRRRALMAALVAATLAVTPFAAQALPPGFDDNSSVVDAVAKAGKSGKLVIVYFAERTCERCTALDDWLVRGDIRQAFKDAYHFSMVFGDDMVPEERQRWRATYTPRGAPAWVVLSPEGQYVCTFSGGFANANEALDLHKLLARVTDTRKVEVASKASDGPTKPRICSEKGLGLTPSAT